MRKFSMSNAWPGQVHSKHEFTLSAAEIWTIKDALMRYQQDMTADDPRASVASIGRLINLFTKHLEEFNG